MKNMYKLIDLFGHDDWSNHASRQDIFLMDMWHTISGCRKRMKELDPDLYEYLDENFNESTKVNPKFPEDIDRETKRLHFMWKTEFKGHTDEEIKEHRKFVRNALLPIGVTPEFINSIHLSTTMSLKEKIRTVHEFAWKLKHENASVYDALFMIVNNNLRNNTHPSKDTLEWICDDVWVEKNLDAIVNRIKDTIEKYSLGNSEKPSRRTLWLAETLHSFPISDFDVKDREVVKKALKTLTTRLTEKDTALNEAPQINYIQTEESKEECRKINRNRSLMRKNDRENASNRYEQLLAEIPEHTHIYVHNTMAIRARVFDLFEEKFNSDYVELAKKMNVEVEQAKRWIENVYDLKTLSLLEEAFDTQIVFIPIDPIPESK